MAMKVKLTKPMAIGEEAKKPAGYELTVSDDRAKRWIERGLAIDPSGKITAPPADEPKGKKGKRGVSDDEDE